VAANSLRDELMALPGITNAEVDAEDGSPSGVRVRLRSDADPQVIGAMVQRVLASHGIRSRVAGDLDDLAPVVSLPFAPGAIASSAEAPPPTPEALAPARPAADPPRADYITIESSSRSVVESAPEAVAPSPARPQDDSGSGRTLAALAFEEATDGVTVTAVAADGQRFSRRAAAITDEAVAAAIVAAVGALAEGKPQRMLWVSAATVDGSEVVTVVVEKSDGSRVAGAAIVRGAKAYAVARAAYTALRS
jgi:hypothetical protein